MGRVMLGMLLYLLVGLCSVCGCYGSGSAMLSFPASRKGSVQTAKLSVSSTNNITCGGSSVAGDSEQQPVVATFNAGERVSVQWSVDISHRRAAERGVKVSLHYSDNDSFDSNVLVSNVALFNNFISSTNTAEVSVTLPAEKTSNSVVLQWIWLGEDGQYSVACSDIAIINSSRSPSTGSQSNEAFAIRYSVVVLTILLAALVAAFLYE